MQYPDSPEGVALALAMLILGADPTMPQRPIEEAEALRVYRRCLDAVRDEEGLRHLEVMQLLARH